MEHLICTVCGHTWIARTTKPQKCPKCGNRDWDKPRPEREE